MIRRTASPDVAGPFVSCSSLAEFMANVLADWRETIRTEGVVREFFGDALSARVHEGDIAAVAVEALLGDGHHGRSYPLTGPAALTRREAVQAIASAIGKDICRAQTGVSI